MRLRTIRAQVTAFFAAAVALSVAAVMLDEELLYSAGVAEDARRLVDGVQGAMTATAAVGALLSLMLLSAAQRRLIEPLATLAASARRLARGDYAAQLPERRSDEVGVLTEAFADVRAALQERIDAAGSPSRSFLRTLERL